MNDLARQVATAATMVDRYTGTMRETITDAIKNSELFAANEKLLLCFAIKERTSYYKLLEAILSSDFTEFGFPEDLVPAVDNAFRTKILTVIRTVLLAELSTVESSLTTFANSLEAVSNEDLLQILS